MRPGSDIVSITVTSKGADKVASKMRRIGNKLGTGSAGVSAALYKCGLMVERDVVKNYLSGPRPGKLDRVTGTLAASINTQRKKKDTVAVGSNVEYARIHEFGGTIEVSRGQVAAGGRVHDIKTVIHMPARPFLRSALGDNTGQITSILTDYMRIAVREAKEGY